MDRAGCDVDFPRCGRGRKVCPPRPTIEDAARQRSVANISELSLLRTKLFNRSSDIGAHYAGIFLLLSSACKRFSRCDRESARLVNIRADRRAICDNSPRSWASQPDHDSRDFIKAYPEMLRTPEDLVGMIAQLYRPPADMPQIEFHRSDSGHFALEDHVQRSHHDAEIPGAGDAGD